MVRMHLVLGPDSRTLVSFLSKLDNPKHFGICCITVATRKVCKHRNAKMHEEFGSEIYHSAGRTCPPATTESHAQSTLPTRPRNST